MDSFELSVYLLLTALDRLPEDDPGDGLVERRRGERALVAVVGTVA